MALRYDVLNEKTKPIEGHSFARGFLPNGGHPLVLFRWTFRYVRDNWMLSRTPPLSLELSIQNCNFGSAGKNRKPLSTTCFLQRNRRSRKRKTVVWSAVLRFSPHFRNRCAEVRGKFWNPRAHRCFRAKKPQVEALLLSGVVGMSSICRILPVWVAISMICGGFRGS